MATVEVGRLRQILGPGWPEFSYAELQERASELEGAAGFVRNLARYMANGEHESAGEALEVLAERRAEWEHRLGEPTA